MSSVNHVKKVIVGMSGGVDSSVAALLLKQQGFQVEGLFMKNWEEDDGLLNDSLSNSENSTPFCHAAKDIQDAEAVCNQLNIPLHTVNFSVEYWDLVFENFLSEYQAGRTPNPDILCNREIKFKTFLQYALSLGADYIATGHYAMIDHSLGKYFLKKGLDANKDQSYFLYTLTPDILKKVLFPIGTLQKETVRNLAKEAGFLNHQKKDSTGLCFIGERNFKDFLKRFIPIQPGLIQTLEGQVVGQHDGLMFYTLGQRQGLGIGGQANTDNQPWYVIEKNMDNNTLIVTQGKDHPQMYRQDLETHDIHWINQEDLEFPLRCHAKIRYRQNDMPCTVAKNSDAGYRIEFTQAQRSITPGQSIVFYREDICLGGGIIQ